MLSFILFFLGEFFYVEVELEINKALLCFFIIIFVVLMVVRNKVSKMEDERNKRRRPKMGHYRKTLPRCSQ